MDDDALSNLSSFTGTSRYYQFTRRHLLTDGTMYLAETAGAYWIMDAAASHLDEIGTQDWFVLIRLEIQNRSVVMVYEDGNGHEHARQEIEYTDFPMSQIQLFACWNGSHWVIMLPSEFNAQKSEPHGEQQRKQQREQQEIS